MDIQSIRRSGLLRQAIYALCVLLCLPSIPVAGETEEGTAVARAAVQQETLSGFTRARTRLVLSAEAAGKVIQVNGDVGDEITADQPFACLDPTYLDLEIDANQAEVDSLLVDVKHFRKQVKRLTQLLKQNSSSESQLDEAQHSLDKALSQIQALQVQAETLAERKRRLCVTAPAGWRVVQRHVEVGQWINLGQPVVEVGDFTRLLVPFALSVDEFQALQTRQEHLSLKLPDLALQVPARIERVSPAFDAVSRKIYVELEIDDGELPHRGGIRTELDLKIPLRSGAVLLPAKALNERYEEYWLTRVSGEEIRVVYLGHASGMKGDWVRVISPQIKPGDRFLINPE
jgi:RND family efflux transporter MFP subunit